MLLMLVRKRMRMRVVRMRRKVVGANAADHRALSVLRRRRGSRRRRIQWAAAPVHSANAPALLLSRSHHSIDSTAPAVRK